MRATPEAPQAMQTTSIANLKVELVGEELDREAPTVVLLHGYDGFAGDLSPFAASFGLAARFVFPESPLGPATTARGGKAWWPVDDEGRREALARGPRDLSLVEPGGLEQARAALSRLLDELVPPGSSAPLVVGGFSQGAMLACDLALRSSRPLSGLVLLSGARICGRAWAPLYQGRRGLPAFVSHGRADLDLSFEAAERLQADLAAGGLDVTWLPFDGGHEVPLLALRGLKRFLARLVRS
jgi:phospholipase/carboxylesterase